jgi:hypothetical protein
MRRRGFWIALWALGLWPLAAAGGDLEQLGLRVRLVPGGAAAEIAPSALPRPWPPSDALPDSRPGLGSWDIAEAWLVEPTTRYGHAVLGDALEAGSLLVILRDRREIRYRLPDDAVFEDLEPRVADLDGDGREEVIVVRSSIGEGAALTVFEVTGGRLRLRAETSGIGLSYRWLNPIGVGDFDGDGWLEVAYVETPHIGGILRILRLSGDHLFELGRLSGFSNHALGSRKLGLSAILDLDGDGSDDLLVPGALRRTLRLVSFRHGHFTELGRVEHDAEIVTDLTVADRDGNGRADVAYGLADGTLVELLR